MRVDPPQEHQCTYMRTDTYTYRRKNDPLSPTGSHYCVYTSTVVTTDSSESLLEHMLKSLVNRVVPIKFPLKQWPPNTQVWETGPFRHIQLCPACSRRWLVLVSSLSTWYNPESPGRVLVAGGGGGVSSWVWAQVGNLTLNVGRTISLTGPWHVYRKRMLAESSRWGPVCLFPPCTCRHDALKVLVLTSPQ